MTKKYKRQHIKRGKMTMTPRTIITEEMAQTMNRIAVWKERYREGRKLLMIELADRCRELVQQKAPRIDDKDYARDLQIGYVTGVEDDIDMVAIYFKDVSRKFVVKEEDTSVLVIGPAKNSPTYVYVLREYGPWPADMLPIVLEDKDATVIVRKARSDEINRLRSRISSRRVEIEGRLRSAGAKDVDFSGEKKAEGLEVHDDVGYSVLRKEFGFDGKQEAHWRPAIKMLKSELQVMLKDLVEYINGKDNAFYGAEHKDISKDEFFRGKWFQDKLFKGGIK